MKRAIRRLIQDPLAMKILDGDALSGDSLVVDADPAKRDHMTFDRTAAKASTR